MPTTAGGRSAWEWRVARAFLGQHRDAVEDGQRLLLIVRDEDRADAQLPLDDPDLIAQADADFGVQSRQRFVEQQHPRLDRQSARERDPLLLATRHLVRVIALPLPESPTSSIISRACLRALSADFLRTRRPKATLSIADMFGNRL